MPILMLIIFLETKCVTRLTKWLFAGVFGGWLGDIFLMDDVIHFLHLENSPFFSTHLDIFFILGLVSFLVGHLLYIYVFAKEVSDKKSTHFIMEKPYIILPFIGFWIYVFMLIAPQESDIPKPAVYIYAFIICLMSIMAINRWHAVSRASWWIVFVGSLLFIVSDFSLSIKLFFGIFPMGNFIIKSSYLLAQGAIVYGCLMNPTVCKRR